jgi:hypothetical protein
LYTTPIEPEPMTLSSKYRLLPRLFSEPEDASREAYRLKSIIRSGDPFQTASGWGTGFNHEIERGATGDHRPRFGTSLSISVAGNDR